jgi:hypothetical protein
VGRLDAFAVAASKAAMCSRALPSTPALLKLRLENHVLGVDEGHAFRARDGALGGRPLMLHGDLLDLDAFLDAAAGAAPRAQRARGPLGWPGRRRVLLLPAARPAQGIHFSPAALELLLPAHLQHLVLKIGSANY